MSAYSRQRKLLGISVLARELPSVWIESLMTRLSALSFHFEWFWCTWPNTVHGNVRSWIRCTWFVHGYQRASDCTLITRISHASITCGNFRAVLPVTKFMCTTVLKIPHVCNGQKLQIVEILPSTPVTHHSYVDSSTIDLTPLRHRRKAVTAYNDLAAYTFGVWWGLPHGHQRSTHFCDEICIIITKASKLKISATIASSKIKQSGHQSFT